jgi:hypothetical protein
MRCVVYAILYIVVFSLNLESSTSILEREITITYLQMMILFNLTVLLLPILITLDLLLLLITLIRLMQFLGINILI